MSQPFIPEDGSLYTIGRPEDGLLTMGEKIPPGMNAPKKVIEVTQPAPGLECQKWDVFKSESVRSAFVVMMGSRFLGVEGDPVEGSEITAVLDDLDWKIEAAGKKNHYHIYVDSHGQQLYLDYRDLMSRPFKCELTSIKREPWEIKASK